MITLKDEPSGKVFIIPIKSLKDNPNAGTNIYQYCCGYTSHYLTTSKELKDTKLLMSAMTYYTTGNGIECEYTYQTNDKELAESQHQRALDLKIEHVSYSPSQPIYQTLLTNSPQGKYLIEYEDCQVECEDCHNVCSYKDLLTDDWLDVYIEDICPKCKSARCCDYRPETPEEYLLRIGQNDNRKEDC